ncbi:putative membrane protein [Rhodobacter aestuarii]|uniref:Uncharacterized membrane protein n=2 Tax=Rhodobacter aestuarii TaxID=453582 RepID=A0A1N7QDS4_9RHOB|nr:putative membrane protein [Rhodobacter aestuarii]SIT21012.1 Uncharacterized membrane protein [Rhodobacter aestuarii]
MMGGTLTFAPLLPWPVLAAVATCAAFLLLFALWRGLNGWALRGLAVLALFGALAQPSIQTEEETPLSDIVLLVDDRSASQTLPGREDQTDAALRRIAAEIAVLPNTELRRATVPDDLGNAGTLLGATLTEALAAEPRGRVAGVVVVSDGRLHDPEALPDVPAPLHLLLTGRARDWDRRLVIQTAPAFGIIGEETTIRLRIEDSGAVPASVGQMAMLTIAIDGGQSRQYTVEVGQDLELPLVLEHGGQNVVQFTLAETPGELTTRNNAAVVQINGVRDRLRVLLVSGQPHAGERTWRNLLKSDAGVDLVHFTILRPTEKHDGTPVSELSLIAFPTQELFLEKIDQFDLIIFDRYAARGILPAAYFENIRAYVERGGAVLVSAGPEFATVESLWQTPLGTILPARPTGRVFSEGFLPRPTELGLRHPVTAGLEAAPPVEGDQDAPHWGRWLRQIALAQPTGEVVMKGLNDSPLLVLSRAGEGRVALLGSDHAWLWDRGFEGGGPQLELLRRIAHWAMKEPDLEEEALQAEVEPGTLSLSITRRTMQDSIGPLTITGPDGESETLTLPEVEPGRFAMLWEAPSAGLYRLTQDDLERVVALGPASPKEFENPVASGEDMAVVLAATGGAEKAVEDGIPALRRVNAGRPAFGRDWIGITPREVYDVTDIRRDALLPGWAWLLLAAGFSVAAWLLEGRRKRLAA